MQAMKMFFKIFQNKKTPFQPKKTRSLKSRKIDIFAKGLERKRTFQARKKRSSKSRKIEIFPKGFTHGFGPKMPIFPTSFSGNIGQEIVFYYILERNKTPFQAIKTRCLKSRKIDIFPNELTYGFGPKMVIFPTFFLAIQSKKMSFKIFQNEKTPLQRKKTRSLESRKIDIFSKGLTHGFGPKMAVFQTFFFRQYRPGTYLLRHSRTKKRFSRL